MAIVDIEYEKWQKDFEDEFPDLFKGGSLTGPVTAMRRDLMRTAYMAGKKASRQPSGQEAFAYTRATSAVDPLPVITPAEYAALREQGMGESYRPLALIDGRDAGTGVGDE